MSVSRDTERNTATESEIVLFFKNRVVHFQKLPIYSITLWTNRFVAELFDTINARVFVVAVARIIYSFRNVST